MQAGHGYALKSLSAPKPLMDFLFLCSGRWLGQIVPGAGALKITTG
jgi:hypothetical protein